MWNNEEKELFKGTEFIYNKEDNEWIKLFDKTDFQSIVITIYKTSVPLCYHIEIENLFYNKNHFLDDSKTKTNKKELYSFEELQEYLKRFENEL